MPEVQASLFDAPPPPRPRAQAPVRERVEPPIPAAFDESMSLAEARKLLQSFLDEGHKCPCCDQLAKVYKRPLFASMAIDLLRAYRSHGVGRWFHLPSEPEKMPNGGATGVSRYWGLIEEETDVRRDDGGRAGFWRVTPLGERWLLGEISVPKYARVYDGKLLGLCGEPWTIRQALGKRFNYDEIMASAKP